MLIYLALREAGRATGKDCNFERCYNYKSLFCIQFSQVQSGRAQLQSLSDAICGCAQELNRTERVVMMAKLLGLPPTSYKISPKVFGEG